MDKYTQERQNSQGHRVQKHKSHILEDQDLCFTELLLEKKSKKPYSDITFAFVNGSTHLW